MTQPASTIRIALVVAHLEFHCHPVMMPFTLEGYPPVALTVFSTAAAGQGDPEVRPLAELDAADFDLVLDADFLAQAMPKFTPARPDAWLNGPAARLVADLACQLVELRQKQEVVNDILNSNTDAIVTINEDHVIVGYNHGAEAIFGYSRAEALGQDLKIIIPPPHKEVHRDYLQRYLATRQPRVIGKHVRLTAQRRDGSEFPMSISFSVAEVGAQLFFTGIIRDISEYQQMEARLVQSERLAAVGNTVTHIAHEIKNPLLIIGGFARQLQKAAGLEDKDRRKLGVIAEEVRRLEAMVTEMREFVRRPAAQKQPGNLGPLVQDVLHLFEDTLKEHHIQVRWLEETPLPEVPFDAQQLRQVLINLIKNALEAMPQGGEIILAGQVAGDNVELQITDSGQGMPPEVVAHIFEPYFTTKEKGTGLGLAICQNIVQEHGGCLLADSAPGHGSTFTIQLPLKEA
jgi:PAS domain S-box-containing protein